MQLMGEGCAGCTQKQLPNIFPSGKGMHFQEGKMFVRPGAALVDLQSLLTRPYEHFCLFAKKRRK